MLRLVSFGIVVLALCAGCGRFSDGDSPKLQAAAKIKDAEELNDAHDYQRAVETYEEALRLDPTHADAHFKAAVIYDKKLDQFVPAIYHYEIFLRLERDPEKGKLATDFMNNAQFQYVATLPQYRKMANPDTTKLQVENDSLHRQISELKTDLIRIRSEKSAAPPTIPVARPKEKKPLPEKKAIPSVPVAAAVVAKTYKVQKGDGLQTIARKVYGDPSKWTRILEANPQLQSAGDLRVGQVLRIP
jgi:tetratricopeptide (TPR) repeat protein